jgi:hypothetical protein
MMRYVELPHNKKLNLLRAHSLGCEWPNLEQEHWCLHCGQKFSGHAARVWQDEEGGLWLECGTPDCNGSPIDWAPYPWWDDRHPATKAFLKAKRSRKRKQNPPPPSPSPASDDDDVPF